MLTAPTAAPLENVPIAVPLQDYAVGFVAVQVQGQLQWNGASEAPRPAVGASQSLSMLAEYIDDWADQLEEYEDELLQL